MDKPSYTQIYVQFAPCNIYGIQNQGQTQGGPPPRPNFFFFSLVNIFNFFVVRTTPPPKKKKNLSPFSSPISLIQLATIQPKNLIKTITAFRTVIVF